jgi:hypothetical protein
MQRARRPTLKVAENVSQASQATQARARTRTPAPRPRQSQVRTASPSPAAPEGIEGIQPAQKQVEPLIVLAQAAGEAQAQAAELQVRNLLRPELFSDADSFLRELSDGSLRKRSPVRETVPSLALRPSPKPNRFTNIAREIVGVPPVVDSVEEEREEEALPEVDVFAAAYIGKEKTPCYSKVEENI